MRRHIVGLGLALVLFAALQAIEVQFFGGGLRMLGATPPYSSNPPEWFMIAHRSVLLALGLLPGYLAGRVVGNRGLIWGGIVGIIGGLLAWGITLKSLYDVFSDVVLNSVGGAVGELHYRNAQRRLS